MPEIVDIDDGIGLLLSSGNVFHENKSGVEPEFANIYKWNGNSYTLIKKLPWKNRFNFK